MWTEITLEHLKKQGSPTKKARFSELFHDIFLITGMGGISDFPYSVPKAALDRLFCTNLRVGLSFHYQITFNDFTVRPAGVEPFHTLHRGVQLYEKAILLFLQVV